MILAGSIVADHYWTDLVYLIHESPYTSFEREDSGGIPNLIWIEDINRGTFRIRDVVDLVNTLRSAPLTTIYARVDLARKDRVFEAYEDNHGDLLLDG